MTAGRLDIFVQCGVKGVDVFLHLKHMLFEWFSSYII